MDQKDEQDMPVQSTFRIPTQPRISLQSYFHVLITALKDIVPETLPYKVLVTFKQLLIDGFLEHYRRLVQNDPANNASLGQNIALQLYFDLKFLQNSFDISREHKDQFTNVQDAYKEFIDPFDFELLSTQLMANVKRAVIRYNCILGVLTPSTASSNQINPSGTTVIQEKDPNVLSLCSSGATSLWFPLLPVVSNVNASAAMEEKRPVSNAESERVSLNAFTVLDMTNCYFQSLFFKGYVI